MDLSWLIAGLFLILLLILGYELFSPNSTKQIEKQTEKMQKQLDELCRLTGNEHLVSKYPTDEEKE